MKTQYRAVSFERTPPSEISTKAAALATAGWSWLENRPPRWVARFRKDFATEQEAEDSEEEIRAIMGNLYVPLEEISAEGSGWFSNGAAEDASERTSARSRAPS